MTFKSIICMIMLVFGTMLAVGHLFPNDSDPRNLPDGRQYRQWCCQRCEVWNSGYGPPYTCKNCGKTMNW